jgi:putative transposase
MRRIQLANEEYYHIFNRGVDKRKVFLNEKNYLRFLAGMIVFNDKKLTGHLPAKLSFADIRSLASEERELLVEIIAFCLNPNHYHLILKQIEDNGIEKYLHRLGTSYTKYFNIKNKRTGSLFQGTFKAVHIESNEQLLHTSVYVNCNSEVHGIAPAGKYQWSSLWEYKNRKNIFCNTKIILNEFKKASDYIKFAKKTLPEIKAKKEITRELEYEA